MPAILRNIAPRFLESIWVRLQTLTVATGPRSLGRVAERTQIHKDRHASTRSGRYRTGICLTSCLIFFLLLQWCLPLGTTVQIGADEGFELAKATECLNGHTLYREVWNDQPPLHTFILTEVL